MSDAIPAEFMEKAANLANQLLDRGLGDEIRYTEIIARALMTAAREADEAATKRADDVAIKLKLLLAAVLDHAERDLNSLIECCSTLEFDTDGNPRVVPGTLEEDVREEVAARQELYASARAILKGEA